MTDSQTSSSTMNENYHLVVDDGFESANQLPPTKIRRKYKCKTCGLQTYNPREHLKHRQEAHDEKVKIVECPECQYACQYRQKLNRHMDLVHRKQPRILPEARIEMTLKREEEFVGGTSIDYGGPFGAYGFYPFWLDPAMYMAEPLDLSLPKVKVE